MAVNASRSNPMDNSSGNNPADTIDQAEEDILTHTVSDEALEVAARAEGMGVVTFDEKSTYPYYCC